MIFPKISARNTVHKFSGLPEAIERAAHVYLAHILRDHVRSHHRHHYRCHELHGLHLDLVVHGCMLIGRHLLLLLVILHRVARLWRCRQSDESWARGNRRRAINHRLLEERARHILRHRSRRDRRLHAHLWLLRRLNPLSLNLGLVLL